MAEALRCELFPDDLDAAVAFYVDVLRFDVVRDERSAQAPYVALRRGTVQVGLAARPAPEHPAARRPPTGVELVLEVDDLDAEHAHVVATGWPLAEDLTDRPWGLRDFRVLDPQGYYWRLTTGGDPRRDLLERLRAASIAQDAEGLAALYAEDGVHEFPFTPPGGPTRLAGRAAFAAFAAAVYRSLPLRYTAYRTIALQETPTTLVVEQEVVGVNTATGAPFVLPNVAVIEVGPDGLITRFRDYANPLALAELLGDAAG